FPFYWYSGTKVKSHQVVFPFYWQFTNEEPPPRSVMVGPFMSSPAGNRRTRGLLPIAWFTRDDDTGDKTNVLFPLFYQSSGRDKFSLLTLPAGYRRNGPSRFWYLFPLIFHQSDEVMDASTTVVPPLLLYSRSGPDEG